MGYLVPTQATCRVQTANTGRALLSTTVKTPSWSVTAANGNGGTIYLMFNATAPAGNSRSATFREQNLIALKARESWSFTGISRTNGAIEEMSIGSGKTYILGSATSQRAVVTYYVNG